MGIGKETLIGGPNRVHLVILALSLAKGKNPQAPCARYGRGDSPRCALGGCYFFDFAQNPLRLPSLR